MLPGVVRAAVASAALLGAALAAPSARAEPVASASLDTMLADTASRLCVDLLSGKAKIPPEGADKWYRGYGLSEYLVKDAGDVLLPQAAGLLGNASLMSGKATDGAFAVALGGKAGPTCRMLVYRATAATGLSERTATAMALPVRGWKLLPTPPQYAVAGKRSLLLRRDGKPYLASLLTPTTPGPVVMVVTVAAIPPQVTLPPGY